MPGFVLASFLVPPPCPPLPSLSCAMIGYPMVVLEHVAVGKREGKSLSSRMATTHSAQTQPGNGALVASC